MTTALLVLLALALCASASLRPVGRRQTTCAGPPRVAQLSPGAGRLARAAARAQADVAVALAQRTQPRAGPGDRGGPTGDGRAVPAAVRTRWPSSSASRSTPAAAALQATSSCSPGRGSLEKFQARLTDVEKERVDRDRDAVQVRTVRDAGEAIAGSGHPGQRPAQAAGARLVGRDKLKNVAGCPAWSSAATSTSRSPRTDDGPSAPTCGSTSPRASTSSSTPRSR